MRGKKGAPSGFLGLRGKKEAPENLNDLLLVRKITFHKLIIHIYIYINI